MKGSKGGWPFHSCSTEFDCEYPINAYRRLNYSSFPMGWSTNGDYVPVESVSSPSRRRNFAFCDGSVKFIKETIASWTPYNSSTGDPVGFQYPAPCYNYSIGTATPQVYQKLATRNGGEVLTPMLTEPVRQPFAKLCPVWSMDRTWSPDRLRGRIGIEPQ